MIDPDLTANTVLRGVIDHHVLDDFDAARMGGVDEVLIRRVWRFQPGIDPRPVVAVIAVVIETAAILDGRRDPDGGKTEIANVIELLDQTSEIAAPMRVFGLPSSGIEFDPVTAEIIVVGIAIVKSGSD